MGEDLGTIHVMTGNVVALDEPMMLVREKKNKRIVHAVMYAYRGRVDETDPWEVRPHMTGCYGLYRGETSVSVIRTYEPTDATEITCVFCIGWRGEKFWPQGVNCKSQKEFPEWPK